MTQSIESIDDEQLSTTAYLVNVSTDSSWDPVTVQEPLEDFLRAWDEQILPLNPLYDPKNYGQYFQPAAFAAIPLIVALDGKLSQNYHITPQRFGEVAQTFHDNVQTNSIVSLGKMEQTIAATRRAVRVIEALGSIAYQDSNPRVRATIKNSEFFDRHDLKSIFDAR